MIHEVYLTKLKSDNQQNTLKLSNRSHDLLQIEETRMQYADLCTIEREHYHDVQID